MIDLVHLAAMVQLVRAALQASLPSPSAAQADLCATLALMYVRSDTAEAVVLVLQVGMETLNAFVLLATRVHSAKSTATPV